MQATESVIISKLEQCVSACEFSTLYAHDFVKSRNITVDTKKRYSEIVCDFLLGHMDELRSETAFTVINRKNYDCRRLHCGELTVTQRKNASRKEEHTAIQMKSRTFPFLGEVIDYQVPLKAVRGDRAGKIDLIAVDGTCVRLVELKRTSSREPLLRCILEIYTYYRILNHEIFRRSYGLMGAIIVPTIMVGRGCNQIQELFDDTANYRKLMQQLGVEILDYTLLSEIPNEKNYCVVDKVSLLQL